MAKNNNLKDFVTDIADAIREKKGTTDLINPQDFGSEIRGIESGGGVIEGKVKFTALGIRAITDVEVVDGAIEVGQSACAGLANMETITIPDSVTSIGPYAFQSCYGLKSISIPDNVTSLGAYAFQNASQLKNINLPKSLIDLGTFAFTNCTSIDSAMYIPKTVTTIKAGVFNSCLKIPFYDFSNHLEIPLLENINAFTRLSGSIVVPDALYDQWIVATNWATYANRIVKASEFVEPTNE